MILLFGPSGAGKSVQGRKLAESQNWKWLSAGKLLRDQKDDALLEEMKNGELVKLEIVNRIIGETLDSLTDTKKVILDGFPRQIEQASWLLNNCKENNRRIDVVLVLDVPKDESIKRLKLRGREDDTDESINERLRLYNEEILPILTYFEENDVKVIHINGALDIDGVYNQIIEELKKCNLI